MLIKGVGKVPLFPLDQINTGGIVGLISFRRTLARGTPSSRLEVKLSLVPAEPPQQLHRPHPIFRRLVANAWRLRNQVQFSVSGNAAPALAYELHLVCQLARLYCHNEACFAVERHQIGAPRQHKINIGSVQSRENPYITSVSSSQLHAGGAGGRVCFWLVL